LRIPDRTFLSPGRNYPVLELRRARGTHIADKEAQTFMKKTNQILKPRQGLSLGDLILAVSSCTKNTKETVAAVADLLGSGQVRIQNNGRFTRAQVC
jgi:hypothetical protein